MTAPIRYAVATSRASLLRFGILCSAVAGAKEAAARLRGDRCTAVVAAVVPVPTVVPVSAGPAETLQAVVVVQASLGYAALIAADNGRQPYLMLRPTPAQAEKVAARYRDDHCTATVIGLVPA